MNPQAAELNDIEFRKPKELCRSEFLLGQNHRPGDTRFRKHCGETREERGKQRPMQPVHSRRILFRVRLR